MMHRANMTEEQERESKEKSKERQKRLYEYRKAAGICVDCGKPSRVGKTRCKRCSEIINKKQMERDKEIRYGK